LFWFFDGYYYGALSHAIASFSPALTAAALGGAPLISFLLVLGCAALAEAYGAKRQGIKNFFLLPVVVVLLWIGLYLPQTSSSFTASEISKTMAVSVIQGPKESVQSAFGEVVIYPASLKEGIISLTEDMAFGARLSSSYRKRKLYSLSDDRTPAWLSYLGIEKSSYAITPGMQAGANINGVRIGALICSELHQSELARLSASGVPFVLAVGSDAMFPGNLSGDFSLAAARLRAAENATAVVRANVEGPSAIINAGGGLQALLPYGTQGILEGEVPLVSLGKTLYSAVGSVPLYIGAVLVLAVAAGLRYRRFKALGSSG
jgi:apolipoprotein N-acyltransferase